MHRCNQYHATMVLAAAGQYGWVQTKKIIVKGIELRGVQ